MTMTHCSTRCKGMGASFFLLGLGSLRLQQNFLEAYPAFHDQVNGLLKALPGFGCR